MKLIFMGTPDFAAGAFKKIIEAGHEVTLVVTQPDRPKGRGKEMAFSPVKEVAVAENIPVFQPEKIRRPEAVEELKKYEADVFIVAAFGQILTKEILDMPKYGCINIHASILPKYRGAAPIQWVIINGEEKAGVTIMQMDEGLDTGDMLMVDSLTLAEDETADTLHDKLMDMGANLIVEALEKLPKGELVATPQTDEDLFYAKQLNKEMGRIDFTKSAKEIERLIRAFDSWPGTYAYLEGKLIKICKAKLSDNTDKAEPGCVVAVNKNIVTISCGEGNLDILELQPQGKKRMTTHDYLVGNKITVGQIFKSE